MKMFALRCQCWNYLANIHSCDWLNDLVSPKQRTALEMCSRKPWICQITFSRHPEVRVRHFLLSPFAIGRYIDNLVCHNSVLFILDSYLSSVWIIWIMKWRSCVQLSRENRRVCMTDHQHWKQSKWSDRRKTEMILWTEPVLNAVWHLFTSEEISC